MKPGVYHGMSFEEYEKIDAVNCSTLVAASQSIDSALYKKDETPQMRFGKIFHSYLLEGKEPVSMPSGMIRRGKAWDAFEQENQDREIVSYEDFQTMQGMMKALGEKYKVALSLIKGATERELVIVWVHRTLGCLCKARIDAYHPALKIVVDVKTSSILDVNRWLRSGLQAGGRPHWQPHWYLSGARAVLDPACETFLWVLFLTAPPYAVQVVQAAPAEQGATSMTYLAELEVQPVLEKYLQAKRTGRFPGLPDTITHITLPQWYVKGAAI